MFCLADLVGYVQVCTEIQKSTQSSNTFFDVHLQVAKKGLQSDDEGTRILKTPTVS